MAGDAEVVPWLRGEWARTTILLFEAYIRCLLAPHVSFLRGGVFFRARPPTRQQHALAFPPQGFEILQVGQLLQIPVRDLCISGQIDPWSIYDLYGLRIMNRQIQLDDMCLSRQIDPWPACMYDLRGL